MTAQMYEHLLTVAEYAAMPDDDLRHELQEGILMMSPRPKPRHQDGLVRLQRQLESELPTLKVLIDVDVDLQLVSDDRPGTVRAPDLVVVTRDAFRRTCADDTILLASEIVLAVEFLSPGSVRLDSRIKRAEYADAGIRHYWMIDLDDGPSLVACHLAGAFGYSDAGPVRGTFTTTEPFAASVDLDALVDRD